jgi:hypothetical protein
LQPAGRAAPPVAATASEDDAGFVPPTPSAALSADDAGEPEPAVPASNPNADAAKKPAGCAAPEVPTLSAFARIYDPSVGEPNAWYINDHSIVRGPDGRWHLFGITHQEPADPDHEVEFAHATATSLTASNWEKHAPVLHADPAYGETVLWAPYVLAYDGTYYMFYCGGGADHKQFQIALATSTDLEHWQRQPERLFYDGWDARDPFVMKVGEQWVLYYAATSEPEGGQHIVAYRTSTDLRHWGPRQIAYVDRAAGTYGGNTESPFVVARGADYYLFIGPRDRYSATTVLHSRDPFHFGDSQVTELPVHAPEVIVDENQQSHLTHAGWGQGGVWLSSLTWQPSRCEVQRTSDYQVGIRTFPSVGLEHLTVGGANGHELLGVGFDVPGPYLLVGDQPQPIKPGAPREIERSPDGKRLWLRGMPLGAQPISVDWTFCFRPEGFDHRITWHVQSPTRVQQVGWSLASSLTFAQPSFGDVMFATDDVASLAVAYLARSAFAEAGRVYGTTNVLWQNLSDPKAVLWRAGTYQGGLQRVAVSKRGADMSLVQNTLTSLALASDTQPPCN